ncbi:hypothetical protein BP5796_01162 [Coleophoma crateriformis]|uniref:UbiA prenyltransferase family n=1 Tax=Coleophoma crateriformis TaxID=565419 RepID=A0A3D8T187_9HELO|nr:hypothetical protein BP5796_01162 [Coleophoma crateriformis]
MAFGHFMEEASIAWAFNRRDLTATIVPFSLFTLASSLEAGLPLSSVVLNASKSALLSFLLLYTFTISNQLNGIEEDRLNKPDRPIVSGRVSISAAYTRYVIISVACLLLSYKMQAKLGATMFLICGAIHNFTSVSSFGPTKDLVTTATLVSGLYSGWELGRGNTKKGTEWISCLAVNLLFSISIQDLRDVVGDAATGRYTTPYILGKPYGTVTQAMVINLHANEL